ncbi:Aste57867_17883 [Aphanomyces stellatus]|uniref:Aste57867_17883 protein n=1 Tax=Aphanomyces stellatus TaxID=120398 RepID=A0A485L9X7_9STRA|nr:hypothetical protein As57867_017822 [Aphanomyces stellatus]VFT94626.1 Aste57867_17883 [Aphanomyces stellatus]
MCHRATISRLWGRARLSVDNGAPVADIAARIIQGNSGAKRKRTADEIKQAIKAVPLDDRQTLRCLEVHSGIKKTAIIRHMKEKKKLKAKSNYVKPLLTQANKMARLRLALNCLLPGPRGEELIFLKIRVGAHTPESLESPKPVLDNHTVSRDAVVGTHLFEGQDATDGLLESNHGPLFSAPLVVAVVSHGKLTGLLCEIGHMKVKCRVQLMARPFGRTDTSTLWP